MERRRKTAHTAAHSQHTAQRKSNSNHQTDAFSAAIDNSPRMVAQRQKLNTLFGGAAQTPLQRMAATPEFALKHTATSEDEAKTRTENRTGKLGKSKVNSMMNFGDAATKKAFDDDATASGPAEVTAKGWELKANQRGPGRKVTGTTAKAGKFKVIVSKGSANHCDGWA